jgi:hypothetical protein
MGEKKNMVEKENKEIIVMFMKTYIKKNMNRNRYK